MAKFDPFLPLDCARVGAQSKERKGSNFVAQCSGAVVLQARRAKHIQSKNLATAIWQPCLWIGVRLLEEVLQVPQQLPLLPLLDLQRLGVLLGLGGAAAGRGRRGDGGGAVCFSSSIGHF